MKIWITLSSLNYQVKDRVVVNYNGPKHDPQYFLGDIIKLNPKTIKIKFLDGDEKVFPRAGKNLIGRAAKGKRSEVEIPAKKLHLFLEGGGKPAKLLNIKITREQQIQLHRDAHKRVQDKKKARILQESRRRRENKDLGTWDENEDYQDLPSGMDVKRPY